MTIPDIIVTQDEWIAARESLEVSLDGPLKEDLETVIAWADQERAVRMFLLELLPGMPGEPISVDAAQYMTLLSRL